MMVLGRTKHNLKLIKKLVFVLILFAFGFMLNTNTVKADPTKEAYFKDGTSIDNFFKIRTTYKKGFRKATAEEWAARGNKGWVLSTDDSPYPIYVWDLDTDWVYGSEADIIYLNPDSSNMLSMTNFNSIDLSGVDTSKVTNMSKMFAFSAYVRTLDISNFNTSNVTNMSGMFQDFGVYNLDLRNFNTSKVTDMSYMFKNQYSYLKSVDLSSFDTSKVTDMSYMFMSCDSVTSLNLSNFYTPEVTNMKNMFSGMRELESLDISNFSTSKVTDMSSMFSGIKKLKTLDIRNFNTSNVTDMSGMFSGMSDLESLDVSNFNTSKVTDMSYMFREMDGITSLDLGSFDTSKVTNMKYMFQGSNYLRSINLSSFDTRNVTDMQYMFELCNDLRTIDVSSFKVYNVENMDRMFSYTYNLESVDLSSFDISKVTNMSHMFYTSAVREIDFGSFDTRQVTNMENIFGGSSLRTVYVSELFNTDNIPADQVLFFSTESLVGQNGTAYNSANKTKEYAVIDDPDNGHPGYLTYTEYRPKIHYPDGTVEEVRLYDTFTMPEEYPLNSLPLATVTLDSNYDGADSKYSYVEKQFVFNKWIVKDTEYDPGDTLVVTYDVYLEPDYIEVTNGADLSPAYRENHKFEGWYTDPEGGELVQNYDSEEDLTLYAHWSDAQTIPVTMPEEVVYVPYGEDFNLGINDTYRFYGEAEYVNFDYNTGDGGDPSSWIMAIYLVGDGWTIDGVHYDDNSYITVTEPITVNYNNREYKPPIEMPKNPQNGDKYFVGWYMFGNFDSEPYTDEYYYGGGDVTFVARWMDDPVSLTIDGETTMVERGYVYTVPNATPDPYAPVNNKIHIHLYYMDEEDTQKDVVISEGYSIGYQIINGDTYYPGDTYVVNDETEVVSIHDWNGQYAMDPYIKEPTRDGYIFMGWQLYNWEYYDVSDINVDIYTIEPYYTWFDGASFYAEWQEEPDPDEYVVVRYKDFIKKKDYKKIYPKGYVYTFGDLGEVNPFDVEIRNNVNDDTATATYTTHITSNSYTVKIVGSDDESWRNSNNWYHPGDTYEINEDIEIEVLTSVYTDNSHYNGGCSGDTYLCELAYDAADNSRYNNYIFRGVYTEENGQGVKINPHTIVNNNTYYGSHNGFNTLWVYLEEIDENSVMVTVDGEVFIMPKGEGAIPSPSITSETTNYIITYKFNNGDPDVLGIDTVRYYIDSLNYNGDEYQLGDTFDFEEDTTFWSYWQFEPIGDGLLEVNDEHFLGWFDENDNQVTSLDDIEDNITLYAHWDYPDVNVTIEGETDTVPYGFTYDLAEFKNFSSYVDAGTITFHDASGDYDGDVWTTEARQIPTKATINGVEYELDGDYTFIEDTVIEFEYEFEFIDEELPRDKSIMGREHYTFGGWYDNPDYEGDPITKYSGMNNIDVYAKWIGEEVIVILNEDEGNPLIYHYGDTYTFGDLPESFVWDMGNEIFDFNDGVTPNSTQHLIMTIYPDTWFYYGYDENDDHVDNTYNAGDTVTLYGETWIDVGSEDDNNYVYSGVTIPDDPEREHYTFDGWYNEWDYKVTNINELNGFDQVITAKWIGEDVTVHLPDEDITVEYGKEYPTYENNYPKANTEESEVTFKYHDGETDDLVRYVEKSYTPNGWLINDTHYGEDTIVFTEETTLVPDYAETVIPVEFPSDPTWFRHDFDGWFTEETGGEQVTSYSDLVDTELHAHWHDHMAIITTPDGDVQVDENKQFTFPTNNIPKNNTNVGTIKFDPQNGQPIISKTAVKSYTPNGWLLDGVHYDDGETITVLDDSTITPDYTETISVELPENPIKPNYTFKGWYSAMNGGDKVEVSDMKSAMTVYAHYYETNTEGEEYKLPSNQPAKPTETLATVTFDPHNGDPVTTSTVTKKWMAKGWLVDGVQYYNGDVIYRTPDTVIEPNYTYVIVSAQFPIAPTRGNERYTGWYTQETGGEQVKNYEGTEDITLHAHYTDNYAVLIDGETINESICLMYNSNWSCSSGLVRKFEEGTYEQYQAKADSAQLISTDDSPYPVYLWMQYPTWYYYTEADTIYFNENSNHFFAKYFQSVETINIDKFNSSYVTDFGYFFWNTGRSKRLDVLPIDKLDTSNAISMNYMLSGISNTSVDFSNFNTARVENFSDFLSGASVTSLDVSHLNTSSAKNMYGMFSNLKIPSIDVSNFDTSNATDIGGMFKYTDLVSLDLSNFDTSNVTYMGGLISGTSKLESVNLSSFNTSNVTSFNQFMLGSALREIDLSSFDTSNTKDFYEMFAECPNLEKIWVSDKWDSSSLTSGTRTFYESPKLIGQRGSTYTGSNAYHAYANTNGQYAYNRIDMAPEKPGYFWDKYANKYVITLPDGIEEVYEGAPFVVPTNTYPKNLEIEYTITFDPMNGEEVITSSKMKTYEPVGFTDGENVYESGSTIYVAGDMTLTPYYNEVVVEPDFPEDPIKDGNDFVGWFTEGGEKVEALDNIDTDTTLYAHYEESYSKVLESIIYSVANREVDNQIVYRIVIGAEPNTTIGEFKDNMLNPNEFIKIYDSDNNEVSDDDIVKTGLTIKLVIDGNIYDEATMVVRGDLNGDGFVNVMDDIVITNSITDANPINEISDYPRFAAADLEEDDFINVVDEIKMLNFITDNIDSLNN